MWLPHLTKNVFKMFLSNQFEKARRKEITIEPILWHYTSSKEGLHPVKLKITAYRKTKNYPVQINGKNIFISAADWDVINSRDKKCGKEHKQIREALISAQANARSAANQLAQTGRPFTFNLFESVFFSKETSTGYMNVFTAQLNRILGEGRVGTYRAYKNAYDAFNAFLGGREISPYDVTVDLLRDFEQYLKNERKRKAGATTVGMYARALRAIYNLCADQDPMLKQYYPFGGRGKFKIGDTRKAGKKGDALTAEEIRTFISIDVEAGSPMWEAKLYWLFSFYCQGMNFRDICFLRYANIQGDVIRYTRQKTKRTDDQEILEISITPAIREILDALRDPGGRVSSFVFPIVPEAEKNPLAVEAVVLQKIKTTNKWLKRVCVANGLPSVTTYWSRHSYANLLKSTGTSVEMIRELLGHSDIRTTEHYLKRFDLTRRNEVNKALQLLVNPRGVMATQAE